MKNSPIFSNRKYWGVFLFACWLALALIGMAHHEFWRDEVRALSIAIDAKGFSGLPAALKDEGHPLLWYTLLKLAWTLFHKTWVLPAMSLLFATGTAALLIFRSRLPLWLVAMVLLGTFGLYEYAINSRNYGIAGFFFLLFAHVRSRHPDRLLLQALGLALAVQCNVYAAMLACILAGWVLLEALVAKKRVPLALAAIAIVGASFLITAWITRPTENTLVLDRSSRTLHNALLSWQSGRGFHDLLYLPVENDIWVTTLVLWGSLLLFLHRPRVMLTLFLGLTAMTFFSIYLRANFLHHMGMWFFMYLAMAWLHWPKEELTRRSGLFLLKNVAAATGLLCFSIVLVGLLRRGHMEYMKDIRGNRSESPNLARWLRAHNEGDRYSLISEPDYILESLVYYRNTPFRIPRENTWGTYVHFTRANAQKMSLTDMLDDAARLPGKHWVLLNKHYQAPTIHRHSYEKEFVVDSAGLARLNRDYVLRDSFIRNWVNEEIYFIYEPEKPY